jgi:hypothetical protein
MERHVRDLGSRMSNIRKVEAQLTAALREAEDELSRAECFDDEQRSEVYAILSAIRADTQAHGEAVGRWVNDRTQQVYDV